MKQYKIYEEKKKLHSIVRTIGFPLMIRNITLFKVNNEVILIWLLIQRLGLTEVARKAWGKLMSSSWAGLSYAFTESVLLKTQHSPSRTLIHSHEVVQLPVQTKNIKEREGMKR